MTIIDHIKELVCEKQTQGRWFMTTFICIAQLYKSLDKIFRETYKSQKENSQDQMNGTETLRRNVAKEINLEDLYSALIECFSVILCGYTAGRLNLITQREARGFDVFVRTFSLPSVIFLSLAQLDMSTVNWKFLASILVSKSIVFTGVLIVILCLIRPVHFGKLGLYAVFCTQSNDFALGFPILNALYGKDHPTYPSYIYLLAPISLAFLNPIAYILLEIGKFQRIKEETNDVENENNTAIESSEVNGTSESENVGRCSEEPTSTPSQGNLQPPWDSIPSRISGAKLCGRVFLNIITNPVMLMTVLGLCGNFIYRYIGFVGIILKAFATVFSTTALFVLGLRMVETMHKLKGNAFLTPGILIITKLLVLPLVTREVVSLLQPGKNANDTLDLSSFGFMYGTFPTAPMVFVLSMQYDLELETMSSALVVCTFLSAPLMYISAKMIFMDFTPTDNYYEKLESFQFNIGIIGIPLGVWLIILFIANKSFIKIPHKITGFLIISQIILCIGVAMRPLANAKETWFENLQQSIVAFGLYSSRLWTLILAVTLVILQSRSLCYAIKLIPFFICLAWGVPIGLVAIVYFAFPDHPLDSLVNPNFRSRIFQSVVTLILLVVSFAGTSVCLIVQHRYQRKFAKYVGLVKEINCKDLHEVKETSIGECSRGGPNSPCSERRQKLTDIEEIVSDSDNTICNGDCEHGEDLCSSKFSCTDSQRELCGETLRQYKEGAVNEEIDEDEQDLQILRHIVLLLLLVTSMFVNLMLSIWTLVVEDAISGVYIELLFLNVALNTGQICLSLAVFGFDSRSLFVSLSNRWRKFYYGADTVVLTPVDELGFETTHVCHQFIAHHLRECEKGIAKTKRLRLRIYKGCFRGRTLVSWLQSKHLAKNEVEAIQYASHLLEGRVLRHVENRHHFENSDLLYTFRQ